MITPRTKTSLSLKQRNHVWLCVLVCLLLSLFQIHSSYALQAAGNIDGNFTIERVTIAKNGLLYAWDKKGVALPAFPVDLKATGQYFMGSPRLSDVNKDGKLDIITVVSDKTGNLQMRLYQGDGIEIQNWRFDLPTKELISTPLIADINQDNKQEIIFAEKGKVFVYDRQFKSVDAFQTNLPGTPYVAVADLNNSGVYALYAASEQFIYKWESDGSIAQFAALDSSTQAVGEMTVVDFGGDHFDDLALSTNQKKILLFNKGGVTAKTIAIDASYDLSGPPAIADVDLDGEDDIIVATKQNHLLAFNLNGSPVTKWQIGTLYRRDHQPSAGKVANDQYAGVYESTTGIDQITTYRSNQKSFAQLILGDNVHEYDDWLPLDLIEGISISNLNVTPKLLTPNGDGVNDTATVSFDLSDKALVSLDVFNDKGSLVYQAIDWQTLNKGSQKLKWLGVNTKGTLTPNDDEPLNKGTYTLRVSAKNEAGIVTSADTFAVIYGVRAEIEFPKDTDKQDTQYPYVNGVINISGMATDPNIGESNDNSDFKSYSLYYKPGIWTVTEPDVLVSGLKNSGWLPIPVPLQNQSPTNLYNEPGDSLYPNANVSVRTIQHGLLGIWDTSNILKTPNGQYTLLLKVQDGNGNKAGKVNYDSVVVSVANMDPSDPNATIPDGPYGKGDGPFLYNLKTSIGTITPGDTVTFTYGLKNKKDGASNITATIYQANNGLPGPVGYTTSFLKLVDGTYQFKWNGKNNLGQKLPNGTYKLKLTASSVDGSGYAENEQMGITLALNAVESEKLAISSFNVSPDVLDPFSFNNDGTLPADLLPQINYSLNKMAKVSVGVYDADPQQNGKLVKQILLNYVSDKNPIKLTWDGTDIQGLVLPINKAYTIQLMVEPLGIGGIDKPVSATKLVTLKYTPTNESLNPDITQLEGDNLVNDGILKDGDPIKPLDGNPNFNWRAFGSNGSVQVPYDYTINVYGSDTTGGVQEDTKKVKVEISCDTPCNNTDKTCKVLCDPQKSVALGFPTGWVIDTVNSTPTPSSEIIKQNSIVTCTLKPPNFTPPKTCVQIIPICDYIPDYFTLIQYNSILPFSLYLPTPIGGPKSGCQAANWNIKNAELNKIYFNPSPAYKSNNILPTETMYNGKTTVIKRATAYFDVAAHATFDTTKYYPWNRSNSFSGCAGYPDENTCNSFWSKVYDGPYGSGQAGVTSSVNDYYTLALSANINGTTINASESNGIYNITGLQAWLGNQSGPQKSSQGYSSNVFYAKATQANSWNTGEDSLLASKSGYISGSAANYFDRTNFHTLGKAVKISDFYPSGQHSDIYTFSNIVHIKDWKIDLLYPNGDPVDAFEVNQISINPNGALNITGDNLSDVNSNFNDSFIFKLKPTGVPRRFIEIKGASGVDPSLDPDSHYELRYYDSNKGIWVDIPVANKKAIVVNGILAWWDVTYLNGKNYTVLLRTVSNNKVNQDTIDVNIGTTVTAGKVSQVRDAFNRATLTFAADTLPGGMDSNLVSIALMEPDDPSIKLPSGIVPLGPIYQILPEGLNFNPNSPVEININFTCEEINQIFGNDPAAVSLYNIKDNGELEIISSLNQPDPNYCQGADPKKIFSITGWLNHFSKYALSKKNSLPPALVLYEPKADKYYSGSILVEGEANSDNLNIWTLSYSAKEAPQNKIQLTKGSAKNVSFTWDTKDLNGSFVLTLEATSQDGKSNSLTREVKIDNIVPKSVLLWKNQVYGNGDTLGLGKDEIFVLSAQDPGEQASGVSVLEYRIDQEAFKPYQDPLTLAGLKEGVHKLQFKATDLAGNVEPVSIITFQTTASITPPDQQTADYTLELKVSEPIYSSDGMLWINEQSTFSLIPLVGTDKIANMVYQIGSSNPQNYTDSFNLKGLPDGAYLISYYAADLFDLKGPTQNKTFVLDHTPPKIELKASGPLKINNDAWQITSQTLFSIVAQDPGTMPSGVKNVFYKIGNSPWQDYKTEFKISKPADADQTTIQLKATDNIGNEAVNAPLTLLFDTKKATLIEKSAELNFSPNADGVKDQVKITAEVQNVDFKKYFINFKVGSNLLLDKMPVNEATINVAWDGKINGALAAEGVYPYELSLIDEEGMISGSLVGQMRLDITPPTVNLENPDSYLFNISKADYGLTIPFEVKDNIFDKGIQTQMLINAGSNALVAKVEATLSLPPYDQVLKWNGLNIAGNLVPDGDFQYLIKAGDPAGNISSGIGGKISVKQNPSKVYVLVGEPKFEAKDVVWVGKDSIITLKSAGDQIKAADIRYRINKGDWQVYTIPFGLPNQGTFTLETGSVPFINEQKEFDTTFLKTDYAPPITQLKIDGPQKQIGDTLTISGTLTKFTLQPVDADSGIKFSSFFSGDILMLNSEKQFSLGTDVDGIYELKYFSQDNVLNKEAPHLLKVDVNGYPPLVNLTVGEPQYVKEDIFYITADTNLSVKATSNKADINSVNYQIDGNSIVKKSANSVAVIDLNAFKIESPGIHNLSLWADDSAGNVSEKNQNKLYVDETPPTTKILFEPEAKYVDGKYSIDPFTQISFAADDEGSGVQTISYSIEGQAKQIFGEPFKLASQGLYQMEYYSNDNLLNEEIPQKVVVNVVCDPALSDCLCKEGSYFSKKDQACMPAPCLSGYTYYQATGECAVETCPASAGNSKAEDDFIVTTDKSINDEIKKLNYSSLSDKKEISDDYNKNNKLFFISNDPNTNDKISNCGNDDLDCLEGTLANPYHDLPALLIEISTRQKNLCEKLGVLKYANKCLQELNKNPYTILVLQGDYILTEPLILPPATRIIGGYKKATYLNNIDNVSCLERGIKKLDNQWSTALYGTSCSTGLIKITADELFENNNNPIVNMTVNNASLLDGLKLSVLAQKPNENCKAVEIINSSPGISRTLIIGEEYKAKKKSAGTIMNDVDSPLTVDSIPQEYFDNEPIGLANWWSTYWIGLLGQDPANENLINKGVAAIYVKNSSPQILDSKIYGYCERDITKECGVPKVYVTSSSGIKIYSNDDLGEKMPLIKNNGMITAGYASKEAVAIDVLSESVGKSGFEILHNMIESGEGATAVGIRASRIYSKNNGFDDSEAKAAKTCVGAAVDYCLSLPPTGMSNNDFYLCVQMQCTEINSSNWPAYSVQAIVDSNQIISSSKPGQNFAGIIWDHIARPSWLNNDWIISNNLIAAHDTLTVCTGIDYLGGEMAAYGNTIDVRCKGPVSTQANINLAIALNNVTSEENIQIQVPSIIGNILLGSGSSIGTSQNPINGYLSPENIAANIILDESDSLKSCDEDSIYLLCSEDVKISNNIVNDASSLFNAKTESKEINNFGYPSDKYFYNLPVLFYQDYLTAFGKNYRLNKASIAIDAIPNAKIESYFGDRYVLFTDHDIDRNKRPQMKGFDIGADEYVYTAPKNPVIDSKPGIGFKNYKP